MSEPNRPAFDAMQSATNLLGYFLEGSDAERAMAMKSFWFACCAVVKELDVEFDVVLTKAGRAQLNDLLHIATLHYFDNLARTTESSWVLAQSYGAAALLIENRLQTPQLDKALVVSTAEMYAAAKLSYSS